jgi:glutamine amidotransferase
MFVHNGVVDGMHAMRREPMLQVAPGLFPEIEGSTDSEVLFHLGLTFGLEEDPLAAMERTIGLAEATALVVQPGEDLQVPFRPRVDETVNGRHRAGAGLTRRDILALAPGTA